MRPFYRVKQFFQAISARQSADRIAQAKDYLPGEMVELFRRLSPADQVHAMVVFENLRRKGEQDPDLLAAGLLHDVGKSCMHVPAWQRAIVVLVKGLLPVRAARWGKSQARGWHRPFVFAHQHPRWGAELLLQAGASKKLIHLVRHHQDQLPAHPSSNRERMLVTLQTADRHH